MKTFKTLIVAIIAFFAFREANAQRDKSQSTLCIKTENIKVLGTCSMDKRRIENAAYSIEGVKSAEWNEYTQILTLKYNVFKKEAADNLQKKIASVGNDTEKYKADDAVYQKLPDCCHYRNI